MQRSRIARGSEGRDAEVREGTEERMVDDRRVKMCAVSGRGMSTGFWQRMFNGPKSADPRYNIPQRSIPVQPKPRFAPLRTAP